MKKKTQLDMKRNLKIPILLFVLLASIFSCDEILEDVTPQGDEILTFESEKYLLPQTPLYLNLEWTFEYDGVVSYDISTYPSLGDINYIDGRQLQYIPNSEFKQGTDFFAIRLLSEDSTVLDIDTLSIHVVENVEEIPCNNGALSDFYIMEPGMVTQLDILENDGICEDQISSYKIDVEEPKIGTVELIDDSLIYRAPENPAKPADYFFYSLTVTNNEGEETRSLAKVHIELNVKQGVEECDSLFVSKFYILESPFKEEYKFPVYFPKDDCFFTDWGGEITEVYGGEADFGESHSFIYFRPDFSDSVANIYYNIYLGDSTLERVIDILYIEDDTTANCPKARSDEFYYFADADSVDVEPIVIDPVKNDQVCTSGYVIHILEKPDLGQAEVVDEQLIRYESLEEFKGIKETKIKYEVCDEGKCDFEYIYITVEK